MTPAKDTRAAIVHDLVAADARLRRKEITPAEARRIRVELEARLEALYPKENR